MKFAHILTLSRTLNCTFFSFSTLTVKNHHIVKGFPQFLVKSLRHHSLLNLIMNFNHHFILALQRLIIPHINSYDIQSW
jgi:hypothetical protein